MPSVFEGIAAGARGAFYEVGGVPVTYIRGVESVSLTAIPTADGNRWSDAVSVGVWAGVRSWTVRADDLLALADPYPKQGDLIVDENGLSWKVLSPDGGPVFRELDPEGREFSIATKAYEVST